MLTPNHEPQTGEEGLDKRDRAKFWELDKELQALGLAYKPLSRYDLNRRKGEDLWIKINNIRSEFDNNRQTTLPNNVDELIKESKKLRANIVQSEL